MNFQRVTSQETLGVTRCERSASDFVWCTHESSWHPVVQPFSTPGSALTGGPAVAVKNTILPLCPVPSLRLSLVKPSEATCLVAGGGSVGPCCLNGCGLILGPQAGLPFVHDGYACQRMCLLWLFLLDNGLGTSCLILFVWLGGKLSKSQKAGRASAQPFHV